jgi:hypothetical protein
VSFATLSQPCDSEVRLTGPGTLWADDFLAAVTETPSAAAGLPAATRSSARRRNSGAYPFLGMNDLANLVEAARV